MSLNKLETVTSLIDFSKESVRLCNEYYALERKRRVHFNDSIIKFLRKKAVSLTQIKSMYSVDEINKIIDSTYVKLVPDVRLNLKRDLYLNDQNECKYLIDDAGHLYRLGHLFGNHKYINDVLLDRAKFNVNIIGGMLCIYDYNINKIGDEFCDQVYGFKPETVITNEQ